MFNDYAVYLKNKEVYGFTVDCNIKEKNIKLKINASDNLKKQLKPLVERIALDAMKYLLNAVTLSDIEENDREEYMEKWYNKVIQNEESLLNLFLNAVDIDNNRFFESVYALSEITRLAYLIKRLKPYRNGYISTNGYVIYEGIRAKKLENGFTFSPDVEVDWREIVKLSRTQMLELSKILDSVSIHSDGCLHFENGLVFNGKWNYLKQPYDKCLDFTNLFSDQKTLKKTA